MKINMKLLASSAIVITIIGLPGSTWGMDDKNSDTINRIVSAGNVQNESIPSFTKNMYRDHLNSMDNYRQSVENLIGDLSILQEKLTISKRNPQIIEGARSTLSDLQKKIGSQDAILKKYDSGKDVKVIRTEITEEIEAFETLVNKYTGQAGYEESVKDANNEINNLTNSLNNLDNIRVLRKELEMNQKTVNQLLTNTSTSEIQKIIDEKSLALKELYASHRKGFENAFSENSSIEVLKGIGILDSQLSHINSGFLFNFFTRKLELPHASIQTGVEKDATDTKALETLSGYFKNKVINDIAAFDAIVSRMSSIDQVKFTFEDNHDLLKKVLRNEIKFLDLATEEATNTSFLKASTIMSSYSSVQNQSLKVLHRIVNESPYGLLGLSMSSLNTRTVTSEPTRVSDLVMIREAEAKGILSTVAIEFVQSFIGNHANKVVLDKILSGINQKPVISSEPTDHYLGF